MRTLGGLLLFIGVLLFLASWMEWIGIAWLKWVGLLLVLGGGALYVIEPWIPREAAPISRVVGRPCLKCDKLIAGDHDGAACPVCGKYYHFRCGRNGGCPICGPAPRKQPAQA